MNKKNYVSNIELTLRKTHLDTVCCTWTDYIKLNSIKSIYLLIKFLVVFTTNFTMKYKKKLLLNTC